MHEQQLTFKDKHPNFQDSLINLKNNRHPITLLCDHIDDPTNIGGLFRLADACNLAEIIFYDEQPIELTKKIARISRQTVQYVPYRMINDLQEIKKKQYQIIALELTNQSNSIWEFKPQFPLLLILGNERTGVSEALLKLAEKSIHLPMFGVNNSMNVTNAAGIAVYELIRRIEKTL